MTDPGRILVFNTGSSSLKYRLVDVNSWQAITGGLIERLGPDGFGEAVDQVLRDQASEALVGIGHRVVHGGDLPGAIVIDGAIEQLIRDLIPLAPLHNPAALAGIEASRRARPDVPNVAVFDTAFHSGLPEHARLYAIDRSTSERFGIRRYGFHGISLQHASAEAARVLAEPISELRMIVLHLGNGASATAIDRGRSIDTSMGFTPSEGLVMGTRSGDIDPSVLIFLQRQGFSTDELDELVNRRGGLAGLTGQPDMRDVLAAASEGSEPARLALEVYLHRIRRYLGAFSLELGRVDAIVFTGGVGENSPLIRHRALERMVDRGVLLDEVANEARRTDTRIISSAESSIAVLVIPANEELEIARQTHARLLEPHHRARS